MFELFSLCCSHLMEVFLSWCSVYNDSKKMSSPSIPEKRLDYESLSILLRLLLSLERFPCLIWHPRKIERHVYLIREISLFLGNRTNEERKRSQSHGDPRLFSWARNHDEINYSHIQSCFIPSLWEASDSFSFFEPQWKHKCFTR